MSDDARIARDDVDARVVETSNLCDVEVSE